MWPRFPFCQDKIKELQKWVKNIITIPCNHFTSHLCRPWWSEQTDMSFPRNQTDRLFPPFPCEHLVIAGSGWSGVLIRRWLARPPSGPIITPSPSISPTSSVYFHSPAQRTILKSGLPQYHSHQRSIGQTTSIPQSLLPQYIRSGVASRYHSGMVLSLSLRMQWQGRWLAQHNSLANNSAPHRPNPHSYYWRTCLFYQHS